MQHQMLTKLFSSTYMQLDVTKYAMQICDASCW